MRVKTKYRQPELPDDYIPPSHDDAATEAATMSEATPGLPPASPPEIVNEPPAPDLSAAPPEPQPQQDDATLALKREIERLKQSEQVRQQQRQEYVMPPSTMTREQRLAAWQAEGLSHAEVEFFKRNPAMIDYPQLTGLAINRAKEAGLERGTEAHFAAVEKIFNANLHRVQTQPEPPPQFFTPPPARPAPNPASLVSAPVSRSIPNGSGKRYSPGKVTLTPQEVEAARVAGVSVEEYAKQKLRYAGMRERGEYGDARDQR